MISFRMVRGFCLISGLIVSVSGDAIPGILRGTVVMRDGSPPPFTVGIQRVCSDGNGSVSGPLTNKKGEYIWRMEFDPLLTRRCELEAQHDGYFSSTIDISAINPVLDPNIKVEPLVLTPKLADPYIIVDVDQVIPSKALSAWRAAMKAVSANNAPEAAKQLEIAAAAAPKMAVIWHTLGIVYERQNMLDKARDAYLHAIEDDPKMLQPYVTLARLYLKTKDWEAASKISDTLIKLDAKKVYPEIHLHRAVALYGLKDFAGAEMGTQEVIRQDPKRALPRAEFVLGRILEAKGDLAGAREHMTKYLELDPKVFDANTIKAHLQAIGTADAAKTEPEMELL